MKNSYVQTLAAVLFLQVSGAAMAVCDPEIPAVDFSFGTVYAQRDLPIGGIIAEKTVRNDNGGVPVWTCPGSFGQIFYGETNPQMYTSASPVGGGVMDTNLPGVGIKFEIYYSNSPSPIPFQSRAVNQGMNVSSWMQYHSFRVTLIKTSNSPAGGNVNPGTIAFGEGVQTWDGARFPLRKYNLGLTTIVPVKCSVTQSVIPVQLGDDIGTNIFTGPGSVSPTVNFDIPLDCDLGTRVNFQLDGSDAGTPGVLALNNVADSATGVGVQVLTRNDALPVVFGVPKFDSVVQSAGPFSISFAARYYQTGAVVTGGVANATATFTMTYL
jgi:type 1 fimbria pilin